MKKETIRKIRHALYETQAEFAARMGITPVTVSRWENGYCVPGFSYQRRLAEMAGKLKIENN